MLSYEERKEYACSVCGSVPDKDGVIEHGKGCYTQDEDGGGLSVAEFVKFEPQRKTVEPQISTERQQATKVSKLFEAVERYIAEAGFLKRAQKLNQLISDMSLRIERCPASHKYHGSYPGGLVDHTLEVLRIAMGLKAMSRGELDAAQLAFCAIVHDFGKLGDGKQVYYLKNPDISKHKEDPYVVNRELVQIPHELRTFYWLNMYDIELDTVEYQAIFYHAGMYMPGFRECVKRPESVTHVLHFADMMASQVNGL